MAPSKRKNKKKQKSKLPFVLVLLSFAALYAYWYTSGVELFPSEELAKKETAVTAPQPVAPKVETVTTQTGEDTNSMAEADDLSEPALPTEELMEAEWEKEVFHHIQKVNLENPNEMFEAYVKERKRYKESVERALAQSLGQIEQLNSQTPEAEVSSSVNSNEEHQSRVKEILGPHYNYIEAKRKEFMETLSNLDPTDVETRGQ